MGYALVSAGATSPSLNPSFGAATGSGNLLVAWIACNSSGSTNPITVTGTGWTVVTPQGGGAFEWTAIAYKPNSSAGETAPTFGPAGVSTAFTKLAEFSGGATSSPVDQVGNGGSAGASTQTATCSAADTQAGDLILFASFWNGGATNATISNTMHDGAGNSLSFTADNNSGTPGSNYYNFLWAIATAAGGSGDTATGTLSGFSNGGCGIVSFSPAGTPAVTAGRALVVPQAVRRAAFY